MMELPQPKPKKNCRLARDLPLPIVFKKDGTLKTFAACFNGFSVTVANPEDMKTLISKGYFGKANLSRSHPQFSRGDNIQIVRQRQLTVRKACSEQFAIKMKPEKVIVVPDSDSENDYFTNLRPKYAIDNSCLKEELWLGLEEAFFLTSVVKCLNVSFEGEIASIEKLWGLFQNAQPNFTRNYVVYFYYRCKNWVVKPGIKFGGDFMLYKEGPSFYHSTYIVVIDVVDTAGKRIESLTNRSMDNISILGLNRLCETAGKDLLICRLKWPQNSAVTYEDLTNIEIQEILVKRWIASQERGDTA
ncbi:hypothetical protein HUJ04_007517 [Dendroctonus ponderosae]|uniref:tRNA-splicing endonuclease subunit Sen2 n=2 Tax=Dendroctonus ponderosae TaxID=77166 RepID=A0AAR5PCC4_DENPD|nr:hypothetical protein HUJ04_007517 [Dendroctonus ponderosae]